MRVPRWRALISLLVTALTLGPSVGERRRRKDHDLRACTSLWPPMADPAETEGIIIRSCALRAPRCAGEAHAAGLNTPSLAESWTESKDGLTYEFRLRKGV